MQTHYCMVAITFECHKVETIVKNETSAREEGVPSYPKVSRTAIQPDYQSSHSSVSVPLLSSSG